MSQQGRDHHIRYEGEKEIATRLDEVLFSLEMLATPETLGKTMNEVLDWHSFNPERVLEGDNPLVPNLVGSINFGLDCITGAVMTEIFMVSGSLTKGLQKTSRYLDANGMFRGVGTDMTRLAGLKIKPALQQLRAYPFVVSNPQAGILHLPFLADASLFVKVNDAFVTRIGALCGAAGEAYPRSSSAALPVYEKLVKKTWVMPFFDMEFIVAEHETFCVECASCLRNVDLNVIGAGVSENGFVWA